MKLLGYTDRLSVAPGEEISFMVSSEARRYEAEIVHLGRGELRRGGADFLAEPVETSIAGAYAGRTQEIHRGSFVRVPASPSLSALTSFTLQTWIFPTTPEKGLQGILTRWVEASASGIGLVIDEHSCAALRVGEGEEECLQLSTGEPLAPSEWVFVAASYSAESGQARVWQISIQRNSAPILASADFALRAPLPCAELGFVIAAYESGTGIVAGHFNGKIDNPRIFGAALEPETLMALHLGSHPADTGAPAIAVWDFSRWQHPDEVIDVSGSGNHGRAVGAPTRSVTGRSWTGVEASFLQRPEEYAAIHFHEDDLADADWLQDFSLQVSRDLPSGVYAARLSAGEDEDYVPFFVRPHPADPPKHIGLLIPTLSYLAYANEHQSWQNPLVLEMIPAEEGVENILRHVSAEDHHIVSARLMSLYDHHSDGSGVCLSSRLRPLLNMRPGYVFAVARGAHQFGADLQLVSWLEAGEHEYDVFTDEDLHAEGASLLRRYRVVLTGTHPEYWTRQMLDGLEDYLFDGGRLMYLGGNGFYWVTSIDPHRPHIVEVRRGHSGTRTWESAPGENYHSSTGELGGLWRHRGWSPQRLVGVGFTAQGLGRAQPYRRRPESFDERAAFIFEGVPEDAAIGTSGTVLGGAAGFEIDRFDLTHETPRRALRVATATGFSDSYQAAVEDILMSDSRQGGSVNEAVRADMVFLEYPNSGAVFSVGSIAWCGSLGTDPHVSRITSNVLAAFTESRSAWGRAG